MLRSSHCGVSGHADGFNTMKTARRQIFIITAGAKNDALRCRKRFRTAHRNDQPVPPSSRPNLALPYFNNINNRLNKGYGVHYLAMAAHGAAQQVWHPSAISVATCKLYQVVAIRLEYRNITDSTGNLGPTMAYWDQNRLRERTPAVSMVATVQVVAVHKGAYYGNVSRSSKRQLSAGDGLVEQSAWLNANESCI